MGKYEVTTSQYTANLWVKIWLAEVETAQSSHDHDHDTFALKKWDEMRRMFSVQGAATSSNDPCHLKYVYCTTYIREYKQKIDAYEQKRGL